MAYTRQKSFKEIQRFRQYWLWILLIGLASLFGWGLYQQLILGQPWGTNPAPDIMLILFSLIPIGLMVLFWMMRLETEIGERGITYRFFPFQMKKRLITWSMVDHIHIREYKPLTEFGGWGMRIGWMGNGRALNVSGNTGLDLDFKNGNKLLIGTSEPGEMSAMLFELKRRKVPVPLDH